MFLSGKNGAGFRVTRSPRLLTATNFDHFIYITLLITRISGKASTTAIRRVRKSDNNRIAHASGATIINRTDEIREEDIGTQAGLFEIKK